MLNFKCGVRRNILVNEDYIPAIITASVALVVAVGAQFLSHWLTKCREAKVNRDAIYQEFIYPILPEVLLYYDTETDFRKGHDVEREVDIEGLLNRISQKVSFGNMKLLSAYYKIKKKDHFFDGRGFGRERNTLRFMFWYLDYSLEILNKREPRIEEFISNVKKTQKLYGLWFLLAEESEFPQATSAMKFDFYLSNDFFQEISIEYLKELIDLDAGPGSYNRRSDFVKYIIEKWRSEAKGAEIPALAEIMSHLSNKRVF